LPPAETNQDTCQVDFYLLKEAALGAAQFACRLALMAWQQNQKVLVTCASAADMQKLDELMWQQPPGRFLPHCTCIDENAAKTAVNIGGFSDLHPTDVVINLCPDPVPDPARFKRLLEIVPYDASDREASRTKYKTYREQGLKPQTNEINPGKRD